MLKPLKLLDKPMKVFNKFIHSPSSDKGDQEEDDVESIAAKEQKLFPPETLAVATHGFHLKNKLGEGSFGHVYKGKLSDGREIAVKKLWRISSEGKREFLKEAKLLTRLQHKNVVNLLGYCARGSEKLLVYEYVCHESLDKLLFHSGKCAELDWKRRFIIILGVARGLVYLHQDSPCCIIHQDIKASNILLDDRWIPKIADFGMARLYPENQTYMNTRVAGTNGYMAPEYLMHGTLSVKADVFSFGVLVLEIISGKKNATFRAEPGAQNLLEWAWKLYKKGESLELMDSMLSSSADIEQVAMCIQMGLLCVQADPSLRPDMARVMLILSRKMGKLDEPDRPGYPGSRYKRNSRSGSTLSGSSSARSSGDSSWLWTQTNTTSTTTTTTIPRPPRQPISSIPDPSTDLVETPM